jgi:hypothetical protein
LAMSSGPKRLRGLASASLRGALMRLMKTRGIAHAECVGSTAVRRAKLRYADSRWLDRSRADHPRAIGSAPLREVGPCQAAAPARGFLFCKEIRMTGTISPDAGKPVDPVRLVDVPCRVTAYSTGRPDIRRSRRKRSLSEPRRSVDRPSKSPSTMPIFSPSRKRSASTGPRTASLDRCSSASTLKACPSPT